MEERYWERFTMTGKVEDYLTYKGMGICQNIMEKHEEKDSESVDHSDGDGAAGGTDGRMR